MKTKFLFFITCLLFFPAMSSAVVQFNDGAYHKIDYIIDDYVWVDQGLPGVGTQVEVIAGGGIAPGKDYGYIVAYGNSRVTLSGGQLGWSLWCNDNSTATVTHAYIRGEVATGGHASVDFQGGTIQLSMIATEFSAISLAGGSIGRGLELRDQSYVQWSGGTIGMSILCGGVGDTEDTCLIDLLGSSFFVNGHALSIGQSARDWAVPGQVSGQTSLTGILTGTLANGDAIHNTFHIFGDSDIVYVPEPGMVVLLGLGAMRIRKQRTIK